MRINQPEGGEVPRHPDAAIPLLVDVQVIHLLRDCEGGQLPKILLDFRSSVVLPTGDDDTPETMSRLFAERIARAAAEGDVNFLMQCFTAANAGAMLAVSIARHNGDPIIKYQLKGGHIYGGKNAPKGGF